MFQTRQPVLTGLILREWLRLTWIINTHVLEVITVFQSRSHSEQNGCCGTNISSSDYLEQDVALGERMG